MKADYLTPTPTPRPTSLRIALLAVVLAFNSMFMMMAPTHASSIDEMTFVEGIDNEIMIENCAGIHCNLVADAHIDIAPFYLKDNLEFGLTIGVADFIFSPLKRPPRPLAV